MHLTPKGKSVAELLIMNPDMKLEEAIKIVEAQIAELDSIA